MSKQTIRANARRRSTTSFAPTADPQPGQLWQRRGGSGVVRIITADNAEIRFRMNSGNEVIVARADFLRLFVVTSRGGESE